MRSIQFTAKLIFNQFRIPLFEYKKLTNEQIDKKIRDYVYSKCRYPCIENISKFRVKRTRRYIYLFAGIKVIGAFVVNGYNANNAMVIRDYLASRFIPNNDTGHVDILVQNINIEELE